MQDQPLPVKTAGPVKTAVPFNTDGSVNTHEQVKTHQLEFNGTGAEYFRIWIVNILLTICTLYIYSAWAKVRTKRYFYGNTVLDGSSFEYHATGKQLLLGRMIGLGLVLMLAFGEVVSISIALAGYAILALLMPWAICRSSMFNARMSSYRNVHFGFNGKASIFYKYMFFLPLIPIVLFVAMAAALSVVGVSDAAVAAMAMLAVLSFYVMIPYVHGKLMVYSINESQYGTSKFKANITAGRVVVIYLKSILLSILVMAVFVAVVGVAMFAFGGVSQLAELGDPNAEPTLAVYATMAGIYLLLLPLGTLMKSYLECRLRNYQVNNTTLAEQFNLVSTITTRQLWFVEFTNLLLIIFTLGLGYPWAKVRKARFLANHTQVRSAHSADQFIADQNVKVSAMGEEIGDAFDMDVAVGF